MGQVFAAYSPFAFLFAAGSLIFAFWPLMLLAPLKHRGNGFRSLLAMWFILAFIRVFLLFDTHKLFSSFLISEPLSTGIFMCTGGILLGIVLLPSLLSRR